MSATATGDATLAGMPSLSGALSHGVDLLPHVREDLRIFLWNRLALARQAAVRGEYWLGRLYNRFSGEDADFIELSGTHLQQTLHAASLPVPDILGADGVYQLRLDIVEQAGEGLKDD